MTPIPRSTKTKPRRKTASPPEAKKHAAPRAQSLLALTQKLLEDGKAEELVAIDLSEKSDIADYLVIATGRSQRQVSALAQRLVDGLKAEGYRKISIEGMRHGEWVLIDAGDVIVHLFRPETRSFYNLEKMWGETFAEAVHWA